MVVSSPFILKMSAFFHAKRGLDVLPQGEQPTFGNIL